MANSITPPSWHEDQPNAAEASIANTLASKNMALGGQLLNEYASHRQFAQDDYHNYIQQVNAVQMANIAQAHAEAQGKNVLTALGLKAPGAYNMYRQADPNAPMASDEYLRGVSNAATADNLGSGGKGIAAMVEAGLEPSSVPGAFSSIIPDSAKFGMDSRSKAASIIGGSHITAAQIGANAKGAKENTATITYPSDPLNINAGQTQEKVPVSQLGARQAELNARFGRKDVQVTTDAGATPPPTTPSRSPLPPAQSTGGPAAPAKAAPTAPAPVSTAPTMRQRVDNTLLRMPPADAAGMRKALLHSNGNLVQRGNTVGVYSPDRSYFYTVQ